MPPSLQFTVAGGSGGRRFQMRAGVRHQVECSMELQTIIWQPSSAEILGDGSDAVVPVSLDGTTRLFRVWPSL
jgi:hypothetical protein